MNQAKQYELEPDEAREMTGLGVAEFAMSQGGVSKMLEKGDTEGIQRMMDALRPHITAKDIEIARQMNESIRRLAEETGLPFEEARILMFKRIENKPQEPEGE